MITLHEHELETKVPIIKKQEKKIEQLQEQLARLEIQLHTQSETLRAQTATLAKINGQIDREELAKAAAVAAAVAGPSIANAQNNVAAATPWPQRKEAPTHRRKSTKESDAPPMESEEEAPSSDDEEKFKADWGLSRARTGAKPPVAYSKVKMEANGIKIFPATAEDYRRTIRCLTHFNYEYHKYRLEEEKQHHMVIRRLPMDMKT